MPSSWIMRARDVGTGSRSSHALDLLGQDLDDDAHLAGLAIGVPIAARVLLGERVDVRVGVLLGHLDDASAYLNVAVGVVRILHRERDLGLRWRFLSFARPRAVLKRTCVPS